MKSTPYGEKHIEAKLSALGAKVAQATEHACAIQKLLMDTQTEIADLYENLEALIKTRPDEI